MQESLPLVLWRHVINKRTLNSAGMPRGEIKDKDPSRSGSPSQQSPDSIFQQLINEVGVGNLHVQFIFSATILVIDYTTVLDYTVTRLY